jgi:hypothetical protein
MQTTYRAEGLILRSGKRIEHGETVSLDASDPQVKELVAYGALVPTDGTGASTKDAGAGAGTGGAGGTPPAKPLERMNKAELQEQAQAHGLTFDDATTKAELLAAIRAAT